MTTSSKILGRAWVYDTGDPTEIELWEHQLAPMTLDNKISGQEWAKNYFNECLSDKDLRKIFGLPETGNFQVLFSGEMSGGYSGFEVREWDEQFDLDEEFQVAPIPDEFIQAGMPY